MPGGIPPFRSVWKGGSTHQPQPILNAGMQPDSLLIWLQHLSISFDKSLYPVITAGQIGPPDSIFKLRSYELPFPI